MKNNFSVKVSFKDVPDYPYEWDNIAFITGIKLLRVKTSVITDLLTYDAKLSLDNNPNNPMNIGKMYGIVTELFSMIPHLDYRYVKEELKRIDDDIRESMSFTEDLLK